MQDKPSAARTSSKASFQWEDPFLIEDQLGEEELELVRQWIDTGAPEK